MVRRSQLALSQVAAGVVRRLQDNGFVAYFAGGCVRDQIMGIEPKDFDIATSARPADVLKLFPRSQKVGAAFGVVIVRQHGYSMEVATFRSDGVYKDGRHPSSVTFCTAEQDAQRRDFTCNGLFYDPVGDRLIDYVNGQADIIAKILRAIGDPEARFSEDHLRMMRAVRFAARLEFTIESQTWDAIGRNVPAINDISRERIGQEFRLMLEHQSRRSAVELLIESGLLAQIWPLYFTRTELGFDSQMASLDHECSFELALATLVHDLSPGADSAEMLRKLQQRLALSGEEKDHTLWLLEKLPVLEKWRMVRVATLKRLMANKWFEDLLNLCRAASPSPAGNIGLETRLIELRKKGIAPEPLVTGDDLIKLGVSPGPRFREWLEELYDRQLEDEFPDRKAALEVAKQLIRKT
jgi:poly(A) polymerase